LDDHLTCLKRELVEEIELGQYAVLYTTCFVYRLPPDFIELLFWNDQEIGKVRSNNWPYLRKIALPHIELISSEKWSRAQNGYNFEIEWILNCVFS